ncbi:MAG: DUF4160 domain-containing protein [Candidatus Marinimicrobia bacterium]|nr:DUF4160 domain-containing protein [Candidatus Neomarinimicrobiota bacterium]MCH7764663.1 DUF4160 domain-containing protein [Candidatus Neomarinimicrobiota bacterium]
MPEISRFYGIIIAIFYNEHNPPHFHARYGGQKVAININNLNVLDGEIQPRALSMVIEWASLHKEELLKDWELAKENQPPQKIAPLK